MDFGHKRANGAIEWRSTTALHRGEFLIRYRWTTRERYGWCQWYQPLQLYPVVIVVPHVQNALYFLAKSARTLGHFIMW